MYLGCTSFSETYNDQKIEITFVGNIYYWKC